MYIINTFAGLIGIVMVGFNNRRYSLYALLIIACHFSKAQNNENFYKSMIRENFKLSIPLPDEQMLEFSVNPDYQDSTIISQTLKKKLLLHSKAYFMYDGSELTKDFNQFLKENKHLNLPEGLSKEYTNYKPKFYDSYDNTLIFVDGRWVEKSSLVGVGIPLLGNLLKLLPIPEFKSKKQKNKERALKIITETMYPEQEYFPCSDQEH